MSEKYICIHGHFYQPPRENPWLEEVEAQEAAHPYHDWNMRIAAECYAPNSVSRIMDPQGRIIGLVNNYSQISFNFGPTLLYWIEKHDPELYKSILEADKESMKNFSGHGSAIAQVYNHMIMPLSNRRDKETQVKWGIQDFQARFRRFPEGMWLPEAAVDNETLEVLAENGIKFTILGPLQAKNVRKIGEEKWTNVSEGRIDTKKAYLCRLASGKTINVFFYDRTASNEAAFGSALSNGEFFGNMLLSRFKRGNTTGLESLASDGELYGHHHAHGDMSLAYCLYYISANKLAQITNFSEFLEKFPPEHEVEIIENTSWSCSHGVERWRNDCGDSTGTHPTWHQAWRKPLREAMDWLRDLLAPSFEAEAGKYLKDPWEARNEYIQVILDRSRENVDKFLADQASRELSEEEKRRVMKLLEMQRQTLLMYTSCGWFFEEISGIETTQVMMYAARAMQLAKETFGTELEPEYVNRLKQAPSNRPEYGDGAKIYELFVKPAMTDLTKISALNIISNLLLGNSQSSNSSMAASSRSFEVTLEELEKRESGKFRLALGRLRVFSRITLDEDVFGCAAVWLGDHNVSCGSYCRMPPEAYSAMKVEIRDSFEKGQINEAIQLMPKHFGSNTYSLKNMFKDDQKRILGFVIEDGIKKAAGLYDIVYHDNSALMRFMKDIRFPIPHAFKAAANVIVNNGITQVLSEKEFDVEALQRLIDDAKHMDVDIDLELFALKANERIATEFTELAQAPEQIELVLRISQTVKAVKALPIHLNLWFSQNIAFKIAHGHYREQKEKKDDPNAQAWVAAFRQLCDLIGIRLE
ncbi:MAG: DUF3536 domain-containing protein [Candidatus Bathyarchaeia archaeon]